MTLGFLMIVLTFLDSGELSAAFVNTPTLEECEARGATVRTILEEGNVTIEQLVCRALQAQFEPFMPLSDDRRPGTRRPQSRRGRPVFGRHFHP